jgi:hypothetical protein
MVKRLLVVLALSVLAVSVAQAQTACTSSGLGSGGSLISTSVVTCGTLKFDDFQVINPTGGAAGTVDLLSNSEFLNGTAYLQLNPNLQASQDEELLFQVVGGVTQIDLTVGGVNASVTERACANSITTSGPVAYSCSNASHTATVAPLAAINDSSSTVPQPVSSAAFPSTNPIYIFKDIQTGVGGALSEFTESFQTSSPTPEPGSMLLFGSGLLALGWFWRRKMQATAAGAA